MDEKNDEQRRERINEQPEAEGGESDERRRVGHLEGMDPLTGDYIRPSRGTGHLLTAGDRTVECPLDAAKLGTAGIEVEVGGEKQTAAEGSSKKSQRTWSRRLVHTLSNRSRQQADGEEGEEDDGADNCIFGHQIRFTVMAISTLCLSSILSNILTFNFTYICMAGGDKPAEDNSTAIGDSADYAYSSLQRSALFMAVAVGALLAVFPLTVLLNKYGSRLVFGCLGYSSAVATLLLPLAAELGFPLLLAVRLVQGVAFSACLPVMGSITSHWSTLKQNGIFIAILSSFLQIAPIFTMPVSGELCISSLGWPSVYYLHGLVCVVLFTLFMLYHRNTPHKHPLVSRKEIVKVTLNKGGGSIYSGPAGRRTKKPAKAVPYSAVYADSAIWAILVASFGNFMGTQLSLQFMPTYINKVLHLPIEQTGMASAISPVIMFFIKLLAGQSSDRLKFVSEEWKLRIYNSLAMGLMGLLFIVLALLDPVTNPSMCLVVLVASTCVLGFNSGGFFKSSQMVSRQHSHFTLANISFLNCVCMLIVPLLNELVAPENEPSDWSKVLWIHGVMLNATNLFFCVFASAKAAKWTADGFPPDKRKGGQKKKAGHRISPANKTSKNTNAREEPPKIVVSNPEEPSVY